MGDVVVAIDFPAIKRYVFGTNAAREIRGASALLDHLNVVEVPAELRRSLGEQAYQELYMGGGAGMFVAKGKSLDDVERALQECRRRVQAESRGGLEFVWGYAERTPDMSFGDAIRSAHAAQRVRKHSPPEPQARGRIGVLAECQSCSAPGASSFYPESDADGEWLCDRCDAKRRMRHRGRGWAALTNALGLPGSPEDHRHQDFNKLASSLGALALVYMDGDGLGALVQTLNEESQYALFSRTVDESLQEALREELRAWRAEDGNDRHEKKLPVDVLLLGGDDLVFVTRAELALRFAIGVSQRFQALTQQRLTEGGFNDQAACEKGLSVSAGVALFKPRHPFRTVLDQAESLLRNAKHHRANAGGNTSWVDLLDVRQSRFVDIEDARAALPGASSIRDMTLWPMSSTDARRLLKEVQNLRDAGFGVGHAKRLAKIVESDRSVAFETRRMLARGPRARTTALRHFFNAFGMGRTPPWRLAGGRWSTGVLDLAVLLPLIEKGDGGR